MLRVCEIGGGKWRNGTDVGNEMIGLSKEKEFRLVCKFELFVTWLEILVGVKQVDYEFPKKILAC